MRILQVTLNNYGQFVGQHTLRLDGRGLVLVLGMNHDEPRMNSNASGKSTVFDAIDWCEFGVVPRADHVDSIVNEQAGGDTWVRVDHELDDGSVLVAHRSRKPADKDTPALQVWLNDQNLTTLDVKETQAILEHHLGVDREVFHSAVLFGQTDRFEFADATDKERIDILTKVLQLGIIDVWLEMAKSKRQIHEQKMQTAKNQRLGLEARVHAFRQTDIKATIDLWERQRQERVQRLEAEAAAALARVPADASAEVARFEAELQALSQAGRLTPPDTLALDGEVARANAAANEAKLKVMASNQNITRARQEYTNLAQKGVGVCNSCGQPVTADYLETKRQQVIAVEAEEAPRIAEQQGVALQANQHAEKLTADKNEMMRVYNAQLSQTQDQFRGLQMQLAEANRVGVVRESLMREHQRMVRDAELARYEINPHLHEQAKHEHNLAQAEAELASVVTALAQLEDADRYFDFWLQGFGPKGLKSYIVDARLEEMNQAANYWIYLLTGGTYWVRFETQTKSRTADKLFNKFNIRTFRYNRDGTISERNYRSCSGGEK